MSKRKVFMIDLEGKKYYNDEIHNHLELARAIIALNFQLGTEFKKSGSVTELYFLMKKGWILGEDWDYRIIKYNGKKITEAQKKQIEVHKRMNFSVQDYNNEIKKGEGR